MVSHQLLLPFALAHGSPGSFLRPQDANPAPFKSVRSRVLDPNVELMYQSRATLVICNALFFSKWCALALRSADRRVG